MTLHSLHLPDPGNFSSFCFCICDHSREPKISEIMQYLSFSVQLILCSVMSWRFIYVVACTRTSFDFTNKQYSIVGTYQHFIYPFICGQTLKLALLLNNAAMNIGRQGSVRVPAFHSFAYTPHTYFIRQLQK